MVAYFGAEVAECPGDDDRFGHGDGGCVSDE